MTQAAPAPASAPTRSAANPAAAASAVAKAPPSTRDPAAILGDRPAGEDGSVSTKPREDPFTYFVQAGAYARPTPKVARRKTAKVLTPEEKAAFLASRPDLAPKD